MSGNGYYKYRCKYFLTDDCENWVWVNGSACAECVAAGRESTEVSSPSCNTTEVPFDRCPLIFSSTVLESAPAMFVSLFLAASLPYTTHRLNHGAKISPHLIHEFEREAMIAYSTMMTPHAMIGSRVISTVFTVLGIDHGASPSSYYDDLHPGVQ